jgi:transcriptional regulator with XRE-family HTH domain
MIDQDRLYAHIGEQLKNHREARDWTQLELADRVKLERTSITNIERGKQKLPIHVLFSICRSLGITVNDVLPRMDQVSREEEMKRVSIGLTTVNVPASFAYLIDGPRR